MNMKGCIVCDVKHQGFYVSSDEVYMCPRHKKILSEEDEELSKKFKKNRFVVEGKTARMSVYNKQFEEKHYKVIVDVEDIPLLEHIRWREDEDGHAVTSVKKGKKVLTLKLMDYLMYLHYGIKSPSYHPNCNNSDCRKLNIRVMKDKRRERSTVKNII